MIDVLLETDRLLIRPFKLSDIEPSYEMNLDAEVSKYTGDGGVVSKAELERRITEDVFGDYEKYGYGRLAVELKGVDQFIGFTGLKYLPDLEVTDIGFRFKRKYWGKGIATESSRAIIEYGFNDLMLDKIVGLVLPENIKSVNVLKKLGFIYEKDILEDGLLARQYVLKNTKTNT